MSRVPVGCPPTPLEIHVLTTIGFVVVVFLLGVLLVYGWERWQDRLRGEAE